MRIGIVDLDTSHPQNWVPIERDLGHEVVGVWDGGDVHPAGYAAKFAADLKIPRVFATLEEMVAAVDCAVIHGCDWDTHVAKARPFVEAGKAVLIDKPVAGKAGDLAQIRAWAAQGARITGGSSLRFCVETREWLAKPVTERGTPHTVLCGCGVDEFNYGIHAYAMLSGIMGAGIDTVQHLSQGGQRRLMVTWQDGRCALLLVGGTVGWLPFHATIVTERACHQCQANSGKLYRALLETTLPYLAGQVPEPPVPVEAWLEPELCALAARQSWLCGDRPVRLADLRQDDTGYDGKAFAIGYRKARYPNG